MKSYFSYYYLLLVLGLSFTMQNCYAMQYYLNTTGEYEEYTAEEDTRDMILLGTTVTFIAGISLIRCAQWCVQKYNGFINRIDQLESQQRAMAGNMIYLHSTVANLQQRNLHQKQESKKTILSIRSDRQD